MSPSPIIHGRLAPSPTGRMHVGHARSFLLAWWSARSQGGRVSLRIEDIDQVRAREEWSAGIIEDLLWLGLDWDAEPVLQSEHLGAILAAADVLMEAGAVYPCVCSRREVREAASAPHEGTEAQLGEVNYPGTCRGKYASIQEAEQLTGRRAALRFRVPKAPVEVLDLLSGRHSFTLDQHGGDFVVMRRGGQAGYQLGVVVEDARMGINEVLRGDDLLVSAARQQLLQRALGLTTPRWIHVPLVRDAAGARLAKRAGSISLADLREEGLKSTELVSWVARSAGLRDLPGRDPAAYLPSFELQSIPRQPVSWD